MDKVYRVTNVSGHNLDMILVQEDGTKDNFCFMDGTTLSGIKDFALLYFQRFNHPFVQSFRIEEIEPWDIDPDWNREGF